MWIFTVTTVHSDANSPGAALTARGTAQEDEAPMHSKSRTLDGLILFAALAVMLDGYTTWVALHAHAGRESDPGVVALIGELGLGGGLVVMILGRLVALGLVAWGARRYRAYSELPWFALALVAAAATWLVVLSNISAIAHS